MPGEFDIFASSSALERTVEYSHGYEVEPNEIECCGAETIMKFCSHKFLV